MKSRVYAACRRFDLYSIHRPGAILRPLDSAAMAVGDDIVEVSRLVSSFCPDCPNCRFVLDHFARRAPMSPLGPTCPMPLQIYPQKRLLMQTVSRSFSPAGYLI